MSSSEIIGNSGLSITESSTSRSGAFTKRRNPLPDYSSDNDFNFREATPSTVGESDSHPKSTSPLHLELSDETIVTPFMYHQRMEFEAALLSKRNKELLLSKLVEVAPRGRLSLINLSRRGLGKDEAKLLREAILVNPHLVVLKLPYNCLGDEGASIIASAIFPDGGDRHHSLSVLELAFNSIGDSGCGSLALRCIAGNFNLQTLCLTGNQFGQDGVLAISAAILHGTGLRRLRLTANKVGPLGMKAVAEAVTNNESRILHMISAGELDGSMMRPMEELYLGDTSTSSDGFSAIPPMILVNSSLKALSLSHNNLGDQDIMYLSHALSQNKRIPLESLQLSFNEITCQGVECLMNAIWGSETLLDLKLDNNKMKDRGAQLCGVILTSVSLQTLDLSFNKVTTVGIKALMKNLSENSSVRSLAISGIPLDHTAAKAVSFALAYNTSLKALYLDNCSTGYSSQRHIVAGVVSNRQSSLRILTGFGLSHIAMTLGMPWLPESWSNDQVLGFFSFMWEQWLLKSKNGNNESNDVRRGPAPPAAVAAASKIAFSSLGANAPNLLRTEDHRKSVIEGAPVDSALSAFMERTESGTLLAPPSTIISEAEISDFLGGGKPPGLSTDIATPFSPATSVKSLLEDHERRSLNLRWLRLHFRFLSDVGRLPFHNADLWQLHQYFFSPPFYFADSSASESSEPKLLISSSMNATTPSEERAEIFHDSPYHHGALVDETSQHGMKRPSSFVGGEMEEAGHLSKKAKNLKPRIEYFPRILAKFHSLGTKPIEQTLSLLRQLKYIESDLLGSKNLYIEESEVVNHPSYCDVEMILLDLL